MIMSRYLFAMWDGGGAVAPELGVARRLISHGHEVRVIADPTLRDQVLGIGADFAPWVAAPHRTSADPAEDLVKDWEVTSPFEGLRRMRDRLIGGPAGRIATDTAEQIAAYTPDALVADYFLFGAMIAAQGAGLPVAALMPNIWALPVRGVPPIAAGFPLAKGPLGRVRDAALVALVNRVFAKGLPSLNGTRAQHGLPPLTSFYDQVLTVDRILVLTSPTFDYAAPFVPANARYVGAILDEPGWTEPWTHPWTPDPRPLVVVGLGSTFQNQAALLQRIIDAMSTLPVRAIVTTGPAIDPGELVTASNVRIVRSAPHGPLIAQAAAVVTHCGHGTTLKSLAAGVPIVCIPMGRDQDDTAARVVHHGAGVRLSPTASAGTIRAAVIRVLEREQYRAAAMKIASAITDECESSTLVAELENLPRTREIRVDGDRP
jgi:MGT family glycosyltransferase